MNTEPNTINAQTPAPMRASWFCSILADCPEWSDSDAEQIERDSILLAAAYNAFDKAGRSLGIDAAELAGSIDLTELIIAAWNAHESLTRLPDVPTSHRKTVVQQLKTAVGSCLVLDQSTINRAVNSRPQQVIE